MERFLNLFVNHMMRVCAGKKQKEKKDIKTHKKKRISERKKERKTKKRKNESKNARTNVRKNEKRKYTIRQNKQNIHNKIKFNTCLSELAF
jgi:hypothetical protein